MTPASSETYLIFLCPVLCCPQCIKERSLDALYDEDRYYEQTRYSDTVLSQRDAAGESVSAAGAKNGFPSGENGQSSSASGQPVATS